MFELFNVRDSAGILQCQVRSLDAAEREIEWCERSGIVGPFVIHPLKRGGMWDKPIRFGAKWPRAKLDDLSAKWLAGVRIKPLTNYFGTDISSLCRILRKLQLPRRCDEPRGEPRSFTKEYREKRNASRRHPEKWEKHGGLWTERECILINRLYDEGESVAAISEVIPRTQGAIQERLRKTARNFSMRRNKRGRFIRKRSVSFSPLLESPSGP